ncbi:unnamed protein product [Spirodela intermedia]|uniref:Uncharacterized protein n=1 Tax=Spirodela intermedia TaxID=51605 RepID=A0A7I8JK88_SPIIN|nr:unnamed protein product [Spirodela intermedia]CAA6670596.1 unnamed protein product [Spirodela intermedia]
MMMGCTAIMTSASRHAMTSPRVQAMITAEKVWRRRSRCTYGCELDVVVVRQKVDGYHASHRVRVRRLNGPEQSCAEQSQGHLLPFGCVHHKHIPEGACRARPADPRRRAPPAHAVAALVQISAELRRQRSPSTRRIRGGPFFPAALSGVPLQLLQGSVGASGIPDELFVGAGLHHLTLLDDRDHICIADGRETVRDDDGGPAHGRQVQGLLDNALRLGVQRAGRLVKEEDLGGLYDCPRDGDPLLLPTRHLDAPLATCAVQFRVKHLLRPGQVLAPPSARGDQDG